MQRVLQLSVAATLIAVPSLSVHAARAATAGAPPQRAVNEANALVAAAPVLDGATESADAPVKRLSSPPQTWTFSAIATQDKFWTVQESAAQAYQQLTGTTPHGLTQNGSGMTTGPHHTETYAVDMPKRLPAGIDDAELELEVTATGPDETAIAAYALAVAEPDRRAKEILPTSTHRAKVEVRIGAHRVRRANTVTGSVAKQLASDFNALQVPPRGGEYSCPAESTQPVPRTVVSFHFGGHKLRTSISQDSCGFVGVRRGGHRLPSLLEARAFDHDSRADLAPRGH